MQIKDHRPTIIAHRGASIYAPENTVSSFKKAFELKADGIEFDVKLSKDGHIVVIHDPTVDRTTDGSGYVKDLRFDELQRLDAGSFFSLEYKREVIPSLNTVFDQLNDQIFMNIELTNYTTINDGLAKKVCALVKNMGMEKRILFSSFHPINLLIAKRLLPQVPVAILALPHRAGYLQRSNLLRWLSPNYVHPFFHDVNLNFNNLQHRRNRKVNVWTVNEESEMIRIMEAGSDGIITDDPVMARKVLGLS
jgi:glycerophosphoryl diester phosphodiesterase